MNSVQLFNEAMTHRPSLADLLGQGLLQVPGVYDALSARIAQRVGFKAVSLSGNALSASHLGLPDMGILTLTEMVEQTRRIVSAVNIPVIADADTGYGGPLNIIRVVREYEAIGVAAIHIEDQATPKKCAYLPGDRRLVSIEEQCRRLAAALAARTRRDMLLIARTDASAEHGLDDVLQRCRAYEAAGADWVFCSRLQSLEQAQHIAAQIRVPLMVNLNLAGGLRSATVEQLQAAHVAVALYPSVVRNAVVKALTDSLSALRHIGGQEALIPQLATDEQYDELLDVAYWQQLERSLSE